MFLVLRNNISINLETLSSLPITGSNPSLRHFLFISTANSSKYKCLFLLAIWISILSENFSYNKSTSIFIPNKILFATPSPSSNKERKSFCTVTVESSSLLSKIAFSIILFSKGVYKNQVFATFPTPITLIISSLYFW